MGRKLDDESAESGWICVSSLIIDPIFVGEYHDRLVNMSPWNASRTRKKIYFPVVFIPTDTSFVGITLVVGWLGHYLDASFG